MVPYLDLRSSKPELLVCFDESLTHLVGESVRLQVEAGSEQVGEVAHLNERGRAQSGGRRRWLQMVARTTQFVVNRPMSVARANPLAGGSRPQTPAHRSRKLSCLYLSSGESR